MTAPNAFLLRTRAALRTLGLLELGVGLAMLSMVIILIFSQVVARYLFDEPQAWIEELCTYAFIWIVFTGASVAMKLDRHIRVSTLEGRISARVKIALRALGAFVVIAALAVVAVNATRFVPIELRSTSIALPINIPRAFFFSIPLIWACVSMSIAMLYIVVCDIYEISTGWRPQPVIKLSEY